MTDINVLSQSAKTSSGRFNYIGTLDKECVQRCISQTIKVMIKRPLSLQSLQTDLHINTHVNINNQYKNELIVYEDNPTMCTVSLLSKSFSLSSDYGSTYGSITPERAQEMRKTHNHCGVVIQEEINWHCVFMKSSVDENKYSFFAEIPCNSDMESFELFTNTLWQLPIERKYSYNQSYPFIVIFEKIIPTGWWRSRIVDLPYIEAKDGCCIEDAFDNTKEAILKCLNRMTPKMFFNLQFTKYESLKSRLCTDEEKYSDLFVSFIEISREELHLTRMKN